MTLLLFEVLRNYCYFSIEYLKKKIQTKMVILNIN